MLIKNFHTEIKTTISSNVLGNLKYDFVMKSIVNWHLALFNI